MIGVAPAFVHWFAVGFKETLAMIWLMWWLAHAAQRQTLSAAGSSLWHDR